MKCWPMSLIGFGHQRPRTLRPPIYSRQFVADVACGSKTEVPALLLDFCFTPQSRHQQSRLRRPFGANNRNRLFVFGVANKKAETSVPFLVVIPVSPRCEKSKPVFREVPPPNSIGPPAQAPPPICPYVPCEPRVARSYPQPPWHGSKS
jgi:hypothetical protein